VTSAPTDTSGSPGTTGREHDADLGSADLGSVDGVDRLRLVLLRLTRRIRTHTNSGITPSQMAVLATIIRHQLATVGQIAEIEHVQPPSVSKIVGTLEKIGYVERSVDPDDRRCAPLVATPAGLAYADEVRAAGRTWLAEQLDELDVIDVAAIQQALPALERLLASQL
jgi:DNA-binding MarR family transcriptional regulator